MQENKVLIITYYWPPSGGSGVQRWLKFVKYLPQFGWTPYVFTPENPSFVQRDESLLKDVPPEAEVIHFPIWEPYDAFFALTSFGKKKSKTTTPAEVIGNRKSMVQKIAGWIRGNFIIPDPKIFWVRPSVSFLSDFLITNNIKTIITTGPPHSVHLIGLRLKKKNPSLHWIADFRDPWSEWPFLHSFQLTGIVKRIHKKMEYRILQKANHLVTINPFYQKRFEILSGRKVTVLTNGFDEDDFKNIPFVRPEKFTIRHIGVVFEMANPQPFAEAITRLMNEVKGFRENAFIEFIGEVNTTFKSGLQNSPAGAVTTFSRPVPHAELLSLYGTSSILLLNIDGYVHAEGLLPGKVFEYLATGLPILGIGPTAGDSATVLRESGAGEMFEKNDVAGMVKFLAEKYNDWLHGAPRKKSSGIQQFSRKEITSNLVKLLR